MTAFEEMGVMSEIGQAVEEMDWTLPTDVQSEAIPMILGGGDVLMAAETGSGKTGAFCLPIMQIVYETLKDQEEGKGRKVSSKTAASGGSNWKMNMHDRGDAMAIGPEGLLCQARDQQKWHGTRSNKAITQQGRYYFEATVTDEGLCRVGWATDKATLDLGTDKFGFGFGGTGKKSWGRQFDSYGEPYGMNDTVGCYLDIDNAEMRWSKNGVDLGKAYDIPPHLRSEKFYAAVTLKNAEMEFNFGKTPFKFPPGKNFVGLAQAPSQCVVQSRISSGVAVSAKPAPNAPQAIIIEPSRELAEQTFTQIQKFKVHLSNPTIRELLIIGGVNVKDQLDVLQRGVDIVVGTPGRLEDLISTGKLLLHQVRFFVLDECDGLLSQGYSDLINRLHQQIPKVTNDGKRLQMVVCSATLHSFDVKKMAERLMYFPTWIDLKGQDAVPETVHHVVCRIDPTQDTRWKNLQRHVATDGVHQNDNISANGTSQETYSEAVKKLKGEYLIKALEEHKMDQALIFCRTKLDCDNMEKYLLQKGGRNFSCVCLHGDRKPQERKANLQKFKDKGVKYLICTDVAARGIDVGGLQCVINVTLPDEKQNYIHRIGRVGRADRMGLAISFVSTVKEKVWYHSNCNNRGRGCYNTSLTDHGGCCVWYDEPKLLLDIQEHLDITIETVEPDLKVPINEFDGKVIYGNKRKNAGSSYQGHVDSLAPAVKELADLEKRAQTSFIDLKNNKRFMTR
ncbi:ATP-dependent RNA helicase DDX1-like [Mizuhopecten yessoensis]|uniref:ATP-dependent RNA helicase DDX1-like n=1 Tax=Mizuhopecten yessoensis TaxID=6573 RepID=UPI000B45790D|nr:ATP-dependent RNA helicase DDX1-like [Mizuhopecten yessoensis]